MNSMQISCFLAVAETLNFARAAEQLHVTQPAVTQQIHSLEAELNLQLFRRTTRTVELTQDGLIFLGDAKAISEIFDRVKKRAESAVPDTRESIVIGCHSSNDILGLTQPLRQMRQQFTNLYPTFHVVPFQHLYQRLLEEAVDVVIAFRNGEVKKAIHYQELVKVPLAGVIGDQSFLGWKKDLRLCDLKQVPIIVLDPQKCPDEYRKFLHYILDNRSTAGVYFCNTFEAAVTLSQAGYGVAILPDLFLNRNSSLRYIPIAEADPISYGVYYKTIAGHPVRRLFVKLVKAYFADTFLSEQTAAQN